MKDILVFFHCPSNSGYAIAHLERAFLEMARRLVGTDDRIHFAYPDLSSGRPASLPSGFSNIIHFDPADRSRQAAEAIEQYIGRMRIGLGFGFDQPTSRPGFRALRRGGIEAIVSYWGAPMSSINRRLTLALKRIEVALTRFGPDHYIFESEAMRDTAVHGRGIARGRTSVAYLGVDTALFSPAPHRDDYVHAILDIPQGRHIVYYSGHMQHRKGVAVIMRAAVYLVETLGIRDVHFLLLGNRPGEEEQYQAVCRGTRAENHVTFGGYRRDVAQILRGCSIGTIASTGWDSFTMSSLEIASTGLPLVVSRLQGLTETIEEGVTGHSFPVDDHVALASILHRLLADGEMRASLGAAARERVLRRFTLEHQTRALVACCTSVVAGARQRP